ncbi:MAG TPA: beta-propeller fold lactonase family protein [Methylomirabilota bacterium]|nr:beta-propeller fold lactonase family protein [Methylomirabilota bacterium]
MHVIQTARSTRFALAAIALAALGGCAEMQGKEAEEPTRPRVFVANESSNNVTVVDGETFAVVGTVDARNHATHDLAVSRDGRWLFATNLASGRLSAINTRAMETVASIATGDRAHVVTLTNDNRQAWVANIGDNTISIVDTTSFRILGTIAVGKGPTGLTFSRDGRFAYVSNQGDKTVEVIDTAAHRVVKAIPVGTNPHFLVLGPDGRIWGTNTGGTDIYVIDPAAQDKIASINVGPSPQQIAFGFKGLQGPNAYVTVAGLNRVVVLSADPANLRILEQIDVGQRPNGISGNREGTRLFVVHEVSNDLKVIDTGSSAVLATVPVGRKPIRVVFHGN